MAARHPHDDLLGDRPPNRRSEQGGKARVEYGEWLFARLSQDLTEKHGRGFSERNVEQMRALCLDWEIWRTPSAKLEARAKCPALSSKSEVGKQQTVYQRSQEAFHPQGFNVGVSR